MITLFPEISSILTIEVRPKHSFVPYIFFKFYLIQLASIVRLISSTSSIGRCEYCAVFSTDKPSFNISRAFSIDLLMAASFLISSITLHTSPTPFMTSPSGTTNWSFSSSVSSEQCVNAVVNLFPFCHHIPLLLQLIDKGKWQWYDKNSSMDIYGNKRAACENEYHRHSCRFVSERMSMRQTFF